MIPVPVIAIFDIGKTNKKFFLFNEQYKIVLERSVQFEEIKDEDGFPCDDVNGIKEWVTETMQDILKLKKFTVRAFNCSAYGASFVHINSNGDPVTPLYNYLKPYPPEIHEKFYKTYGGEFSIPHTETVLLVKDITYCVTV